MNLTKVVNANFSLLEVNEQRLDAANSAGLRDEVAVLLEQNVQRIILDLSQVEFMDSSSLGVLVGILKLIGGSGDLVIAGAKGIVLDLFELTCMNKVFRMTSDVESAVHMMTVS